jgi:hypothetical protein
MQFPPILCEPVWVYELRLAGETMPQKSGPQARLFIIDAEYVRFYDRRKIDI